MKLFEGVFTVLTYTAIAIFAVLNASKVDTLGTSLTTNAVSYVKGIGTIGG